MICFTQVNLKFKNETILKNFHLKINPGEKVALSGPSGCGKTSILYLTLGFLQPNAGTISINNHPLTKTTIQKTRAALSWLPQNPHFAHETVADAINRPFTYKKNRPLKPTPAALENALAALGLENQILRKNTDDLSGGQKQRLALTVCKLLQRPLLILDEPTAALDDQSSRQATDLFLKDPRLTVLSASHDPRWLEANTRVVTL